MLRHDAELPPPPAADIRYYRRTLKRLLMMYSAYYIGRPHECADGLDTSIEFARLLHLTYKARCRDTISASRAYLRSNFISQSRLMKSAFHKIIAFLALCWRKIGLHAVLSARKADAAFTQVVFYDTPDDACRRREILRGRQDGA